MNPLAHIPARVRLALYVLYAVAGPVMIYLAAKGITGEAEYALYVGLGIALGLTAASNITSEDTTPAPVAADLGETVTLDADTVTRGVPHTIYRSDEP